MTLLEDWLTVAGLLLLTIGTGAQALASLGEFRGLLKTLSEAANQGVGDLLLVLVIQAIAKRGSRKDRARSWWQRLRHRLWERLPGWLVIAGTVVLMSLAMFVSTVLKWKDLRTEGSDDAATVQRFLRTAEVWAIIAAGSALTLAAAVIQLVHA